MSALTAEQLSLALAVAWGVDSGRVRRGWYSDGRGRTEPPLLGRLPRLHEVAAVE
jgi:hypothetical protein